MARGGNCLTSPRDRLAQPWDVVGAGVELHAGAVECVPEWRGAPAEAAGEELLAGLALGEIPPVSETKGAKQRLKNLGYFTGPVNGVPDGHFSAAVMAFQADHMDTHGLEKTGELDTGTAGALEEIHGS